MWNLECFWPFWRGQERKVAYRCAFHRVCRRHEVEHKSEKNRQMEQGLKRKKISCNKQIRVTKMKWSQPSMRCENIRVDFFFLPIVVTDSLSFVRLPNARPRFSTGLSYLYDSTEPTRVADVLEPHRPLVLPLAFMRIEGVNKPQLPSLALCTSLVLSQARFQRPVIETTLSVNLEGKSRQSVISTFREPVHEDEEESNDSHRPLCKLRAARPEKFWLGQGRSDSVMKSSNTWSNQLGKLHGTQSSCPFLFEKSTKIPSKNTSAHSSVVEIHPWQTLLLSRCQNRNNRNIWTTRGNIFTRLSL